MSEEYGTVNVLESDATVRFDRILDDALSDVWEMLTTAEGLERWLAPSIVDLRVGGNVDVDFGEESPAGGAIMDLVPGRSIEYVWRFAGEPDSIIRFDLESVDGAKTRLRLHHRRLPTEQAIGYGAGWHAHLDQLADALAGGADYDWMARFDDLMPHYQSANDA